MSQHTNGELWNSIKGALHMNTFNGLFDIRSPIYQRESCSDLNEEIPFSVRQQFDESDAYVCPCLLRFFPIALDFLTALDTIRPANAPTLVQTNLPAKSKHFSQFYEAPRNEVL